MHLWRKVKRVWFSATSKLKPHKPNTGLSKLQDDIKMCGYKDVQVMWNLLNPSQTKQIESVAAAAVSQSGKCIKQKPTWLALFRTNQKPNSAAWSVKSSKTEY